MPAHQPRTAALAKIHIARKELAMEDEDYRALLQRVAGVASSRDLDAGGLDRVLAELRRLGFKPKPGAQAGKAGQPPRKLADDAQSRMMRGLWIELHDLGYVRDPSEAALAHFAKRMTRSTTPHQAGVDALQWLSGEQAEKLIEELKKWRDRDALKLATRLHLGGTQAKKLARVAEYCEQLSGSATLSKANLAALAVWLTEREAAHGT